MKIKLPVAIQAQPDDTTCGPTSLQAVYSFYGDQFPLEEVIGTVNHLPDEGTLAVYLGLDALSRGYQATIYSYNLRILDPTWRSLQMPQIIDKLRQQLSCKEGKKLGQTIEAYIAFLEQGGVVRFDDLTIDLIKTHLANGQPLLTGLSATYLYDCSREFTNSAKKTVYDDIRGVPVGHFVVLTGFDGSYLFVADPYRENPFSQDHHYRLPARRIINAIMLGILTYDANLLAVRKPGLPSATLELAPSTAGHVNTSV